MRVVEAFEARPSGQYFVHPAFAETAGLARRPGFYLGLRLPGNPLDFSESLNFEWVAWERAPSVETRRMSEPRCLGERALYVELTGGSARMLLQPA